MTTEEKKNDALLAEEQYKTAVEDAYDYVENFDILETITNVGNDEVFTPRKTADMMLDTLPEEVWHNPNYKWLNPATKNGIFEREIAIRLDKGLEDIIPDKEKRRKHILQDMIFSLGQTKFTSNVARRTVYYCSQANRKCDGIKAPDGHYVNGYAIGNGTWFSDEEGNIKTPNTNHYYVDNLGRKMPDNCVGNDRKKYKCIYCGITGDSKYNDKNQREKYAYEFIHITNIREKFYFQERFFKGDKNMKFDIIIGNPPYQLDDGGNGSSAKPIYNLFVEQSIAINPKYICMIIPSRWFAGGKGLDNFRAKMLNEKHFSKIVDFPNPKDCFPNNNISGGVMYFLWDSSYNGLCEFTNVIGKKKDISMRKLNEYDIFIRYNTALPIIEKVLGYKLTPLSQIVSSRKPFGLDSFERGHIKENEGDFVLLSSKGKSYIEPSKIKTGENYINKYKVAIGKALSGHIGETDENGQVKVLAQVTLLKPNEVCSESYLVVGEFNTLNEAQNLYDYLHTKFSRFLLLQALTSMNITKDRFCFVPTVDFKTNWDDKKLFNYFNLSGNEIELIDSMIKPFASGQDDVFGEDEIDE